MQKHTLLQKLKKQGIFTKIEDTFIFIFGKTIVLLLSVFRSAFFQKG